ncbi:MAG: ABC transporter ATP-binding protein [Verrucomicrobiota bacterium]|nr:ABC transporter ATP-binding protein [Verrucomicrobiota bacterium]
MIKLRELVCGYNEKTVIDGISFDLEDRGFLGIIGPNGSGKTTLLRALTNLIKPFSGAVLCNNRNICEFSNLELARKIAVVRQSSDLDVHMTVEEFVLLGRTPYMKQWQFFESQEDLEIAQYAMKVTDTLSLRDRYVNTLSGGERQLTVIARALVQETGILILDEPTNHLDITHQIKILNLIKRLNHELSLTVVTVLHDLNLASEYCDHLILLNDGKMHSSGTPAEVLTYQNIEDVYKTPVIVKKTPLSDMPHVFLISEKALRNSGKK